MTIDQVEVIPLSYATDDDPPTRRSFAVLKLTTEEGLVGWGEASDCYGHRHPLTVKALVEEDLQYALLGREPAAVDELMPKLRARVLASLGAAELVVQVLSAIEIALRDLAAKENDEPLSAWLGRHSDVIPVYAAGKPAMAHDAAWHVDFLAPVLDRGARAVKVRPCRGVDEDSKFLREVRRLLGAETTLLVDGKYNYFPDSAIELSKTLGDIGAHCFEEPVADVDLREVARVAGASPVPLAYGEHAFGVRDFQRLIDEGGVRVLEPDVTVCGGIDEARRIADLVSRSGAELIPHVGGLTAIGFAANLHFAASLAERPLFEYDARAPQPLRDELAVGSPFALERITDGALPVPTGPGLGIEVDEEVFERYPYVVDDAIASTFPTYGTPHL